MGVAQGVDAVEAAVSGVADAVEVGIQVAGFRVGDLLGADQPQALDDAAVGVGLVGFGDGEVDQCLDRRGAACRRARGGGIHHHDVDGRAVVGLARREKRFRLGRRRRRHGTLRPIRREAGGVDLVYLMDSVAGMADVVAGTGQGDVAGNDAVVHDDHHLAMLDAAQSPDPHAAALARFDAHRVGDEGDIVKQVQRDGRLRRGRQVGGTEQERRIHQDRPRPHRLRVAHHCGVGERRRRRDREQGRRRSAGKSGQAEQRQG